jgi:SAM-dependent MidA family methyltransferase
MRDGERGRLPEPPPQALAASRALAHRLALKMQAAGGWIGFDAWMAQALYEPHLGYYGGAAAKFGPTGDFVTAPELGSLFGRCLARHCAAWFEQGVPARITEFGAGSGALAAQLLVALDHLGVDLQGYDIVELSGELAQRQREHIASLCPQWLNRVGWLSSMPETFSGIVIGNELLDAMPVRLFRIEAGRVFERGVVRKTAHTEPVESQASDSGPAKPHLGEVQVDAEVDAEVDVEVDVEFAFSDRPADPVFAAKVEQALGHAGWPALRELPAGVDYVSELAEQALGWISTVASRLKAGAVLLADYGFPSGEFYHPQRHRGTLVAHYRHRVHEAVLQWPGLQDLTAHVDFGAVARAALDSGAQWLGYTSQASFLLGCGVLELAAAQAQNHEAATLGAPPGVGAAHMDPTAGARLAREIQQLVSEAEMGELFKVCAFCAGVSLSPGPGFSRTDRSDRLQPTPIQDL